MDGWRRHRRWFIGQFALWAILIVVLRVLVVPAEANLPVDASAAEQAADAGGEWLQQGQAANGKYLYGYYSEDGEVSADYNNTRHTGVMSSLYVVGRTEAGDRGLEYVMRSLVTNDDWTAFAPPGDRVDVGANALLTVALMNRRKVTGERRYDLLAKRIGRFMASQQQADGTILQFWNSTTREPVPDLVGKFSTGEAFYAYGLLNQAFPDEGWDALAHEVADYLATRRDAAEGNFRQPDHWAAYGLAALATDGLTDTEVDYARWLAGYFGYLTRYEAQNFRSKLNQLHESGASLGTMGEAMTALWQLAGEEPRLADLREPLGARISTLAGVLVDLQTGSEDPDPRARGAWFFNGYTQMDDQQHAIAAMAGSEEVLR